MNKEPCLLYIPTCTNGNIVTGVLVDPTSCVDVIMEETLLINFLHKEEYEMLNTMIRTHNGLSIPPLGSITLSVLVGPRAIDTSFDIILGSNFFRVKLGIPWLVSMNEITSIIHKYLKFSHEGLVHVMHNTEYKLLVSCGGFSLDHFWPTSIILLPPRTYLMYHAYVKYKARGTMPKVTYPTFLYAISMKGCMVVQQHVASSSQ